MRIDAVPIGDNPPHDVNVVIEVEIGGEPVKYEMDKEAGAVRRPLPLYADALSRQLRVRAAYAVG
jgi:inorganic pyrophosphatase